MKKIYCDAVPTMIAVKMGEIEFAAPIEESEICEAELTAILMGIKMANQQKGQHVIVYTDNKRGIKLIEQGYSSNPKLHALIEQILIEYYRTDVPADSIEIRYVYGKYNPADKVSRRKQPTESWFDQTFIYN